MHNIFISHYGEDEKHLDSLKQRLRERGCDVRNSSVEKKKYRPYKVTDATIARFQCKKPNIHGSLLQMYGDNVYHTDPETGKVIQENCAHSQSDGSTNKDHYDRDVSGKYVLLSKTFFYFGDKAPLIPECFNEIYNVGRSIKFKDLSDKSAYTNDFISWIQSNYEIGIHGDPCNWKEFSFPKMNIYED